jgi:hypothetical protein
VNRLSRLTLVFSITFAVLIISPAFLNRQFGPYPLMKTGDVIDLFTPLILIPLYWLLFQVSRGKTPGLGEIIVFLVLSAFWVEGQGVHLSANSIGHLLKEMKGGDVYILTNFYDEFLSHYLWHFGLVGLSALLIYRQWQHPFVGERSGLRLESLAGFIHGFNYFVTIIEARTAPLGVPFAILVTIFTLGWGRKKLRQQPLLAFFFVAYLVAIILFAGWAVYWGGLPEFSKVGIIE